LRNAGLVGRLSSLYAGGDVAVVGLTSAIGSAVINNHPMSIANMLALHDAGSSRLALAALVGGDLGPRLLPMGSLAGLLWLEKLREAKVEIPLGRFVLIGLALTLPTLVLSLFMVRWL
jgi:arsenical pump membrane protein